MADKTPYIHTLSEKGQTVTQFIFGRIPGENIYYAQLKFGSGRERHIVFNYEEGLTVGVEYPSFSVKFAEIPQN